MRLARARWTPLALQDIGGDIYPEQEQNLGMIVVPRYGRSLGMQPGPAGRITRIRSIALTRSARWKDDQRTAK